MLPRVPSRRRLRSGDDACSAGTAPQASAASTTSTNAAASVGRSSLTRPSRGMPSGAARRKSGSVTALRITASTPASNATTNASTICSRTSCARDAPIARRTARSRRRPSARTRKRFATLAQAMSSTTVTAPSSTHRDVRGRRTDEAVEQRLHDRAVLFDDPRVGGRAAEARRQLLRESRELDGELLARHAWLHARDHGGAELPGANLGRPDIVRPPRAACRRSGS